MSLLQQFGLGIKCVKEELRELTLFSNEESPKDGLADFKSKFPILFDCLAAKFSLLPSSTRIVEQKHGQLRHSLKLMVGQDFTDSQQQYITNVDYEWREARRKSERKRRSTMNKDPKTMKMSSGVGGIKHDDGKVLQMQAGIDLIEIEKMYSPDIINSYPEDVKAEASVQNQSKKGTTGKDRWLKDKKIELAREKKRRSQFKSIEQFAIEARQTQVDNDKNWENIDDETQERREDMVKLKRAGFWQGIPVASFKEEVRRVLPLFWRDDYASKSYTKGKLLKMIRVYLNRGEIADDCIRRDKCEYLKEKKIVGKESFEARKEVFQACGTEIKKRERYQHNMTLSGNEDVEILEDQDLIDYNNN